MKEIYDENIGYSDVVNHLDIIEGDLLVVASDVTRLFYLELMRTGIMPDVDILISSFQNRIGNNGTLLFPVFNWDFCKGITFDIRTTPGKTGALGNAALKRDDFKRTQHPLYSFMVWGKYSDYLSNINCESSWGDNTVFDFLHKNKAKWLLLDVDMTHGYSFGHHVEQKGAASYRFNKHFTGHYVDKEGKDSIRTYSMFVRRMELNPIEDFTLMEKELLNDGAATKTLINEIPYILIDVEKSYEPILRDVVYNRSRKTYTFDGQNS